MSISTGTPVFSADGALVGKVEEFDLADGRFRIGHTWLGTGAVAANHGRYVLLRLPRHQLGSCR